MKFNKEKRKKKRNLYLDHAQQYRLTAGWPEDSVAGQDSSAQVEHESVVYHGGEEGGLYPGCYQNVAKQVNRRDCPSLFDTRETTCEYCLQF